MQVRLSPEADQDLVDIWSYIASQRPPSADRVIARIRERMSVLAEFPMAGPERPDFGFNLRCLPASPYLLLYLIDGHMVTIVRILDGRRDVTSVLDQS